MGLVATGLLLIIVNTTTPSSVGAGGILFIFILGYIALTSLFTCLIWLCARFWGRMYSLKKKVQYIPTIGFKQAYYYASVVALAPVIFLSLQSVGGVGVYEFILILLLVFLGCIYVNKRTA